MHGFRLNLLLLGLLLAAPACLVADVGSDDDGFEDLPSALEISPGLDEASAIDPQAESDARGAPPSIDSSLGSLDRVGVVAGPTPDPWHGARPGDCNSGPTPDPWNPGQPSESNDGRSGSTSPEQAPSSGKN